MWNSGRPDLAQRESAWLVLPLRRYWSPAIPLSLPLSLSFSLFLVNADVVVCQQSCQTRAEVVHFSALRFRSTRCQRYSPAPVLPLTLSLLLSSIPFLLFLSSRYPSCISLFHPRRTVSRSLPSSFNALSLPLSTPQAAKARATVSPSLSSFLSATLLLFLSFSDFPCCRLCLCSSMSTGCMRRSRLSLILRIISRDRKTLTDTPRRKIIREPRVHLEGRAVSSMPGCESADRLNRRILLQ